ncbi:charged multivesicular body protein 3-like [Tubulanus polymorphus]|uniref:charged multivesicular body protein 3-like n=1 Tax=Tubulanus polymorphus TaxID=672921 RepID=UPI003DA314E7
MGLFGKEKQRDPKEQVREWASSLRKEDRKLDRQIRSIKLEEAKVAKSLKDAAKKGDREVCVILGKEIIRARKHTSKLYTSKAHLNSVSMQMKNQLATLRIAGALEKSTEVMTSMQQLVKTKEIQATMMDLSREMMKAGIIEEMLEDTMEGMDDQDELEEEAQEEVDKVLYELTSGIMGQAPAIASHSLPEPEGATAAPEEDEDVSDMQARLEALRS